MHACGAEKVFMIPRDDAEDLYTVFRYFVQCACTLMVPRKYLCVASVILQLLEY